MDRRRLRSAALALLLALVVGVAAATLDQTTDRSGDAGVGEGSGGFLPERGSSAVQEAAPTLDLLWLLSALLIVMVVLFLVGAVLFPREALKQTLAAGAIVAVAFVGVWLFWRFVQQMSPTDDRGGTPQPGDSDGVVPNPGGGAGGAEGTITDPGALGLVVVAILALGIVGVLLHDAQSSTERGSSTDDDTALAAIGRSAGRAADRIAEADAPLDNEVYRAWKEMTGHLDLEDPGTRTPEEFRTAARDAGMAARDVDALTDLFRDVRYGGATPTDDRETQATDALRRIQDRYADEEGPP